jgi:hypothetical protein
MKFVFDIDGVLRNLNYSICKEFNLPIPTSWYNNEWDKLGRGVYDLIKEKIHLLYDAYPTKYFITIGSYMILNGSELWTHQPPSWRKLTKKWINDWLPPIKIRYLTPQQKENRLRKYKDIILVDDYPHFKSYDRILLIDQPYNQNVKNCIRIKKVSELRKWLNGKNL